GYDIIGVEMSVFGPIVDDIRKLAQFGEVIQVCFIGKRNGKLGAGALAGGTGQCEGRRLRFFGSLCQFHPFAWAGEVIGILQIAVTGTSDVFVDGADRLSVKHHRVLVVRHHFMSDLYRVNGLSAGADGLELRLKNSMHRPAPSQTQEKHEKKQNSNGLELVIDGPAEDFTVGPQHLSSSHEGAVLPAGRKM